MEREGGEQNLAGGGDAGVPANGVSPLYPMAGVGRRALAKGLAQGGGGRPILELRANMGAQGEDGQRFLIVRGDSGELRTGIVVQAEGDEAGGVTKVGGGGDARGHAKDGLKGLRRARKRAPECDALTLVLARRCDGLPSCGGVLPCV